MKKRLRTLGNCLLVITLAGTSMAQSLADKLSEDDQFYKNYGKDEYTKLKIEKDVVGYYDDFGQHITDGVKIYSLYNEYQKLGNEEKAVEDSIDKSLSVEEQSEDFYEKFSNLVVTQDAIGGTKSSFMIGDQISTRFTPLTFNKTNFKGIRWDLWSSKIQLSGLLSRTSPGYVSKKNNGTKSATVSFPTSIHGQYTDRGIKGDRNLDFSKVSPYGDYEWLWSVHAQNTIANKVDVGLTYINHHVSDVKKGERWLSGNIPAGWMPGEIHFEFYDLTPLDTTDAGVYVDDVVMFVNGKEIKSRPSFQGVFRRAWKANKDYFLTPQTLPHKVNVADGDLPVVVAFKTDPSYWEFADGTGSLAGRHQIKEIAFQYTLAGNYLAFVSTDRQIPLSIDGLRDQYGDLQYSNPQRSVQEVYEDNYPIDASGDASKTREAELGATYFGNYIAKSSHLIAVSGKRFKAAVKHPSGEAHRPVNHAKYNVKTYKYRYGIEASSITYGVNFGGELAGINVSGEFALNQREKMIPGLDESRKKTYSWIGVLRGERELGKNFGISADLYHIAPEWRTSLDNMQVSRYFSKTTYSTKSKEDILGYPDYLEHPRPFDYGWANIDDNEDNDPYVESDRRRYPSELDAKDDRDDFYADGRLKYESKELKTMALPTTADRGERLLMVYDDPDGVVKSRNDRNKNGIPDYREDFLLYSSDPPEFELGVDLNNNGSPDYEDDDILPDYGYSVGYALTSDGYKTLGIKGLSLNFRWTPAENTTVDVGGTAEAVNDRDMVNETGAMDENALDDSEGRALVGYVTAQKEVLKRSRGIQYDIGAEARLIRDGIRNDIVKFETWQDVDGLDVAYLYYTDPLRFRQALVGNLVGSVTYNNIANFEYGFRLKLGAQKHFALINELTKDVPDREGMFYNIYTLYDRDNIEDYYYRGQWESYPDRFVSDVNVINRLSYTIDFDLDYDDWRRPLRFLNRLEITPQY
ncbi:MAG: hypothetical protein GF344_02065, partial [Chitinivibrionales bacterium]|nr:hypothetical protein [Chitinivibrionales bacterium]MBD3355879.1 hypothetical protein [Chitinivibrionales bacterium]